MKQLIPMDEHGMFADYNDTALVDSRFVADAFEKGHREVLRSIDQILSEDSGYLHVRWQGRAAPHDHVEPCAGRKPQHFRKRHMGYAEALCGRQGQHGIQTVPRI